MNATSHSEDDFRSRSDDSWTAKYRRCQCSVSSQRSLCLCGFVMCTASRCENKQESPQNGEAVRNATLRLDYGSLI